MKKLFCFIICCTFAISSNVMATDELDLDPDEEVVENVEQPIEKKQVKNNDKSKHIKNHKQHRRHIRKKKNRSLKGKRKNMQYHKKRGNQHSKSNKK